VIRLAVALHRTMEIGVLYTRGAKNDTNSGHQQQGFGKVHASHDRPLY